MKKKLLFLSFILSSGLMFSQVSAGQTDDFEGTTDPSETENWVVGGASNVPESLAGGPAGSTRMLEYSSTGANIPGGRMAFFNAGGNQWSGDFVSEGIVAIQMDVNAPVTDLHIRLGFQGPNSTRLLSTNAVLVSAGSGWTSITLPISTDSDLMVVQGALTRAEALENVNQMRIVSSVLGTDNFRGDIIASTIQVDNISASTTLSTQNLRLENDFNIFPNPSTSNLNLNVKKLESNSRIEVYNILGAKIYSDVLNTNKTLINASQWQNGVYLVRVTSDNISMTKRFVKQ